MLRLLPLARIAIACAAIGLAGCNVMGSSRTAPTSKAPKGTPFAATLSGRNELPPANSRVAAGAAEVIYDQSSRQITWTVQFSGLTGTATAAQIHGPADPGVNAPVIVTLTPRNMFPIVSPLQGSAMLSDAQAADLISGKWYVNIHTVNHPDGEIRGQLLPR